MRMKPSRATWVETRKTRPFWTLSTIRRPSRRPYIRVANESSPSTRSAASRATAVPLPIATATSARWSAGASLTPSPVTATDPAGVARDPDEPLLLLGRRAGDDVQVGQLARRARASSQPASSVAGDDLGRVEAGLRAAIAAAVARMVAGHDDRLDPGVAGRRQRLADAVAERVGEADERPQLALGPSPLAAGEADEPLPGAAARLDQDLATPVARRPDPPATARTASGAPRASFSTRPSRRALVRGDTGWRRRHGSASTSSAGSRRAAGPSLRDRPHSARVNEPGGDAGIDAPRRPPRRAAHRAGSPPLVGVRDRAGRRPDRGRPRAGCGSACRSCR